MQSIDAMKGIILAAGSGTRLQPVTNIIPKCLLPVYDKPMICYSLEKLLEAGIDDVLIITKPEEEKLFVQVLSCYKHLPKISYAHQIVPDGPAGALKLAEKYATGDEVMLFFGDNIFEDSLVDAVKNFKGGAHVFLKQVQDPERFGVATFDDERITNIEEKPKKPKTNYAVVGCYLYDNKVFDNLKTLNPSKRGELEITDLNNIYVNNKEMSFSLLKGFWVDAGTFDGLYRATVLVKNK